MLDCILGEGLLPGDVVITDAGYGKVTWREGTKGKLSAKFAWVRVWPGQGWAEGACAGAEPIWLLIEERADGKIQYAFSNLPAVRRALQQLLRPMAKPDCTYCNPHAHVFDRIPYYLTE